MRVPTSAKILGGLGLLPFIWGAISTVFSYELEPISRVLLKTGFVSFWGPMLVLNYGLIILSFMGGALWGFAAKSEQDQSYRFYIYSVVPALWALFFVVPSPWINTLDALLIGFIGLFYIDVTFFKNALTPKWWLRLRLPLTIVVALCILITRFN